MSTAAGSCTDLEKSEQELRPHINSSSKSMMLSVGKGIGAGSARIAPIPKARACTVCMPLNMNTAKHPSPRELLNWVVPQSVRTVRNKLKVKADPVHMGSFDMSRGPFLQIAAVSTSRCLHLQQGLLPPPA